MAATPVGPRPAVDLDPEFQILVYNPLIPANEQVEKAAQNASFGARIVEMVALAMGVPVATITAALISGGTGAGGADLAELIARIEALEAGTVTGGLPTLPAGSAYVVFDTDTETDVFLVFDSDDATDINLFCEVA